MTDTNNNPVAGYIEAQMTGTAGIVQAAMHGMQRLQEIMLRALREGAGGQLSLARSMTEARDVGDVSRAGGAIAGPAAEQANRYQQELISAVTEMNTEMMQASNNLRFKIVVDAFDDIKILHVEIADRNDEPAPLGELVKEGLRNIGGPRRDNDPVEGSEFFPSYRTVAALGDCFVADLLKSLPCLHEQFHVSLDGEHACAHLCENRCLIARAGADLEDLIPFIHLKRLGHEGNGVRLRDRLLAADGQCRILVRPIDEQSLDKLLPVDRSHRVDEPFVIDTAFAQQGDHLLAFYAKPAHGPAVAVLESRFHFINLAHVILSIWILPSCLSVL